MRANATPDSEVAILARVLGNGRDGMPREMAWYLITLGFSEHDRARMHELAVRNQADALAAAEHDELRAYARAGTILSIHKSKARRAFASKPKKRATR
jgi:hypothetical protein